MMRQLLEGSVLWRFLAAAAVWLDGQWEKSRLSRIFKDRAEPSCGGLFGRLWGWVHRVLCRLFKVLRLDRALEGSIFTRYDLWVCLTAFASPLLPTMAVLGLAALTAVSYAVTYARDPERRFPRSPVTKWLAAFAAVFMTATLLSVDVSASLRGGLLTTAFTLFGLVALDNCRTEEQLDRIMTVMMASGACVAAFGLLQAVFGADSARAWVDSSSFADLSLRVYSTLENPNVLSEYLLLAIPIGAACVFNAESRRRRSVCLVCLGLMCLCLLLTYARGGYLGLAIAAAVFLVLMDRRFIAIAPLMLLAVLAVLPQGMIERLASIGNVKETSTTYRVYIWMATIELLREHWVFGIGTGVEAFRKVYQRYSFNAVAAPHSHSLYLQVLCECGVMGFVSLMGAVIAYFRELGRAFRGADRRMKIRAAALIASGVGFLAQGATDYSFYNYRVILIFWTVMGLGAALANIQRRRRENS